MISQHFDYNIKSNTKWDTHSLFNSVVYNCTEVTRISSPGVFGAYPYIDHEYQYYVLIARQGETGTFDKRVCHMAKYSD